MTSVGARLEAAAEGDGTVTFVGAAAGRRGISTGSSGTELHDDARAMAAALQARGVEPGAHVARHRADVAPARHRACRRSGSRAAPWSRSRSRCASGRSRSSSTRRVRRIERADAAVVVIDPELAPFLDPPPGRAVVVTPRRARGRGARRSADALRATGRRPRPPRDPAVHERVDRRPEGRDAPRPLRPRQHRRDRGGDRDHQRRPRRVVAARSTTTWASSGC